MNDILYQIPINDLIKKRTSVRTYKPAAISEELENKLKIYSDNLHDPFSSSVRFVFINDATFVKETGGKIGTYGLIKGAKNFIAVLVEKNLNHNLEKVGYTLEKLILYATYLGLGTCWLGGTFNLKGLDKATMITEQEILPIITPVGYPHEKKSIADKMIKAAAGSKKRKPWNKLFFNKSLDTPITEKEAGSFAAPLEMVRLAPSAQNKQPWRIIKEDKYWHFFLEYSKLINKVSGYDIQKIDLGIAMCHFELAAVQEGLSGKWMIDGTRPKIEGTENFHYITSWYSD
ncbi:nitroreductase family protein [Natranaerobius thermophilus]|uniref:Nitroreductase n=1 Tax=Natranaerobius thermophilus (strain ATCC BAA-1301 / DSM 18059 / JW/NM-WN-LF) TaxID=457570 RepID=B2A433_NATTJ|nr:nitroreductase family protein [Natranaerobius thermophilus]ACB85135.1 nitroreductase [Natranaerobius thermophilus JW/NM-WN-LF]